MTCEEPQQHPEMSERRSSRLPLFREKSLLTQLREKKEVQVVYCFFMSLVLMSVALDVLTYFYDPTARVNDISYISHLLHNSVTGLSAWLTLLVIHSFVLYPMTATWISAKYKNRKVFLITSISTIVVIVVAPLAVLLSTETGMIVRFSFLMEHVRIFLKAVTFVVETVRKHDRFKKECLAKKKEEETRDQAVKSQSINGLHEGGTEIEEQQSQEKVSVSEFNNNDNNRQDVRNQHHNNLESSTFVPSFSHFVYFTFAPVFVYRDSYPRSKTRDWSLILTLSGEFIAMVYILFHFQKKTALYFINVGKEPFVLSEFSSIVYWSGLHGLWIFLCIGYGMIHLWMNLLAEGMKFANRDFYHDWWMAVNIQENQQKWNRILQAWLYENVYKVVRTSGGSRNASALTVLFVSGVIHEYVVGFTLGLFLPIMSGFQLLFFPLHLIFKSRKTSDNFPVGDCIGYNMGILFFWIMAITGYSLEYYSRQNCPVAEGIVQNSWKDFFTPRSFSCVSFAS